MSVEEIPRAVPREAATMAREMVGSPPLGLRQQLGRLICRVVCSSPCAVFLWLWDPDWHVLALNNHGLSPEPPDTEYAPPELRRAFGSSRIGEVKAPGDVGNWAISLDDQPRIRAWVEARFGGQVNEYFYPVQFSTAQDCETIAFLQVVTVEPLGAERQEAIKIELPAVAATIVRSRDERQYTAVRRVLDLQEQIATKQLPGRVETLPPAHQRWIAAAAETQSSISRAKACVVFRRAATGVLQSVHTVPPLPAGSPPILAARNGIIAKVAESGHSERRYNVTGDVDDVMLPAVQSRLLGGEEVFSLCAIPVVFDGETIATFVVFNKKPEYHLAEAFSQTDVDMGSSLARFLAGVFPTFQLYESIDRIAQLGVPGALDDAVSRASLYRLLTEAVPAIEAAAVIVRRREYEPLTTVMVGGEPWFEEPTDVTAVIGTSRPAAGRPGRFSLVFAIPKSHEGFLALLVRRADLTLYERQLVAALCNELSHVLRADHSIRQALDTIAQMRHAFRAPLAMVAGEVFNALQRLEVCREERRNPIDDGVFVGALEDAKNQLARMRLSLDTSNYLVSEVGPETLHREKIAVSALMKDVLAAVGGSARRRKIEINLARQDDVVVDVDRDLMFHALFNVFDNAVKYAVNGSTVVASVAAEKDVLEIVVTNGGSYVDPADREKIFDMFSRRNTGSGNRVHGRGIGLALSKVVVTAHGGTIRCDGRRAEGAGADRTTFTIRIPLGHTGEILLDEPAVPALEVARGLCIIHHLEDEPSTMSWIPRVLRDSLYLSHRDWVIGEIRQGHNEQRFSITAPHRQMEIVYRVYANVQEVTAAFQGPREGREAVLLDALCDTDAGELLPHGIEVYPLAVKTVGERATLFLTAYWQSLMTNDRLNIPSDRVMPKPPDVPDLLHKLIDVLGIDDGR